MSGGGGDWLSRHFCMWRFLVLLSLSHKVFWVRILNKNHCIDSWHLCSSLLFILTGVPTHKKYRILCYPLRSNSGWLPIMCAYFILDSCFISGKCLYSVYHLHDDVSIYLLHLLVIALKVLALNAAKMPSAHIVFSLTTYWFYFAFKLCGPWSDCSPIMSHTVCFEDFHNAIANNKADCCNLEWQS